MLLVVIIVFGIYCSHIKKKLNSEVQERLISEGFEDYHKNLNNEELINSYKAINEEFKKLYMDPKVNMFRIRMRLAELAYKLHFALGVIKERGIKESEIKEHEVRILL